MKLAQEFKEFIARGNVIDLAVGVIIGGAFGKIVTSLVSDVIMPPIGLITADVPFSQLYIPLNETAMAATTFDAAKAAGIIAYGSFLNTIFQFLIVAACVFAMVKVINRIKREEAAKPAPPPPEATAEVKLLEEIRDLLRKTP